jgi:hypothetical protein
MAMAPLFSAQWSAGQSGEDPSAVSSYDRLQQLSTQFTQVGAVGL